MTQIAKHEYTFEKYTGIDRFSSYWYQLREIMASQPDTVLEVGVGESVVANYLKAMTEVAYTSADFAEDLSPDVVADVRALPFADNAYDTVCAFEVLEHLADPVVGLADLMSLSENIFFSTCLVPEPAPSLADWWYYSPSSGQHISFYTMESLRILAARFGKASILRQLGQGGGFGLPFVFGDPLLHS